MHHESYWALSEIGISYTLSSDAMRIFTTAGSDANGSGDRAIVRSLLSRLVSDSYSRTL
jgi:hypothetical protein